MVQQGITDSAGQLPIAHQLATRAYQLDLANGESYHIPVAENYRGDAANGQRANQGFLNHEPSSDSDVDRAVHRQLYDELLNPNMTKGV